MTIFLNYKDLIIFSISIKVYCATVLLIPAILQIESQHFLITITEHYVKLILVCAKHKWHLCLSSFPSSYDNVIFINCVAYLPLKL